jgi:hypothetical protein
MILTTMYQLLNISSYVSEEDNYLKSEVILLVFMILTVTI